MERNIDDIYDKYEELKDRMNVACDRRVDKEHHNKETNRLESAIANVALSIAQTNSDLNTSNTVLNDRVTSLIWKGIGGFLIVYSVIFVCYKVLHSEIVEGESADSTKWETMQTTLHSIDKTVSNMSIRVNYISQDVETLKDKKK